MSAEHAEDGNPLAALFTLLRTALDLTGELARDRDLPRLLYAFAQFPSRDRGGLIAKLEQEVLARQRSLETGDRLVGPPNPLASLYVGIYDNDRPLPVVTRDTMLRSTMQSTAIMLESSEVVRRHTEDALFEQLTDLAPLDAEALARHHEDLLALAAWCDDSDGTGGTGGA